MKILNIGNLHYGDDCGSASQLRTDFLVKGLSEHGCEIITLSYRNLNHLDDTNKEKYFNDDLFSYVTHRFFCIKSYFYLFYNFFIFPFLFTKKLFSLVKTVDFLLCDKIHLELIPSILICRLFYRKKIIIQYNEFFVEFFKYDFLRKIYFKTHRFFLVKLLKRCDLLIVFSDYHAEYFSKYAKRNLKSVVIPMMLDSDCFVIPEKRKKSIFKIAYAGVLSESNGIDLLIDAFKELTSDDERALYLVGYCTQSYKKILKSKISQDNIFMMPSMSNKDVLSFLSSSDLLVIPKISDERSKSYFSCKLGDYMGTGVSVLATKLGSIPFYINDNEDGFLCEPDSVTSFSKKIQSIINNKDKLFEIGLKGQKKAVVFNYVSQTRKVYDILKSF